MRILKECRFTLYFALLVFFGCEEKQNLSTDTSPISNEKNSNRLVFDTNLSFENTLNHLGNSSNLSRSTEKIKNFIHVPDNFESLNDAMERKETMNLNSHSTVNGRVSTVKNVLSVDSISSLVPDKAFGAVLNQDLEVEVSGVVYKVTSFGTFFTFSDNVNSMYEIIDSFSAEELSVLRDKHASTNDVYRVSRDVYIADTFRNLEPTKNLRTSFEPSNVIYQIDDFCGPCQPQDPTALPKSEYNNFAVYNFGAKTSVGQLIEGVFGTNTSFENEFSWNYRIKVKLYAFNYVVYQSVGLNATMQKRGWTGLWAKHNDAKAEKLVLGWDALLLTIKIPYAMPIGYASFPSKGITKEVLKFTNFDLPTANVTDASIPFQNKQVMNYDNLEKILNKSVSSSLSKASELIWKETEQILAGASYEIKQERIKSYRKIFPDQIKLFIGRNEAYQLNSNEMSFVLDRFFQVSYSASGTAQYSDFSKNVLEPTFSNQKKLYEIEGASVFGAAIFNGQTKGIRIIKEME